jgi:hypothetical protein
MKPIFLITLINIVFCTAALAQTASISTPASYDWQESTKSNKAALLQYEINKHFSVRNASTPDINNNFISLEESLGCAIPPTQNQVNTGEWTFTERLYEASQAVKLGIPVLNATGSHSLKVYVRDYKRASSCMSLDNQRSLLYGQLIRTVIEIDNYDASAGIDLASIAASGTIKHNSQKFYFYKAGFFNAGIDSILKTVTGRPFDVESYHDYQNVMGAVISLLKLPSTVFNPAKIGFTDKFDTDGSVEEDLFKAPIVSYALTSVSKGNSYSKTAVKFATNKEAVDIISNVYKALKCTTDDISPDGIAIAIAKKYLLGLKTN